MLIAFIPAILIVQGPNGDYVVRLPRLEEASEQRGKAGHPPGHSHNGQT